MPRNYIPYTVRNSKSILAFETSGGDGWQEWYRYISIEGKRAYEIGNICGTCEFYFERMEGANQRIHAEHAIGALNAGLSDLTNEQIGILAEIIPNGEYVITLTRVKPTLVTPLSDGDYFAHEQINNFGVDGFWGLPHHPKTEYYRLSTSDISPNQKLFEFLVPMFPHGWLDNSRVHEYESVLETAAPTAVALSILDAKETVTFENDPAEISSHWGLAHYLIDGHHKSYAAARTQKELSLLSFIAVEKGVSSREDIDRVLHL